MQLELAADSEAVVVCRFALTAMTLVVLDLYQVSALTDSKCPISNETDSRRDCAVPGRVPALWRWLSFARRV